MKIFVSSTFTDMDAARDSINKQVQPRLSKKAREQYGQEIDFTDFRWGIDTENVDNSAVKTTITCLQAIDEAAPPMPMVILLGERCSRPLDSEVLVLAQQNFAFTVENPQCGITELEIEYGALRNKECRERAVVCYIDREDAACSQEMQTLRHKLEQRLTPEQILHFIDTPQGIVSAEEFLPFDEVLTDTLWTRITDSQAFPDEASLETIVHRAYMEKKAAGFRSRRQLFDTCMQAITAQTPLLFLVGETGAGKSSLLSRLLVECRDGATPYTVEPVFCALTENVDSGMEVLYRIVRCLEDALGKKHTSPDSFDGWKDYEEQLCVDYEASKLPPLLIGIDAVDQLRAGKVMQELLFLPFGRYTKVQFVVSFTRDIAVPRRFSRVPVIELKPIDEQETREIIRGILSEYNKRELAQSVEDRLVSFSREKLPLQLNLMVQALRMMDATEFDIAHQVASMEGINREQRKIIDSLTEGLYARDLLSFCRRFLKFACERIDGRLYESLRYIAAAPYGMTVEMLKQLSPNDFSEENFLLLRHYLQEVFILRADGRYDFAHKCLRQSLCFVNLNNRPDDAEMAQRLFEELYKMDDEHPMRVSDILYFAHQCRKYNYITDYIINAFWSSKLRYRRQPIRLLLKNGQLCRELIDNLPKYLAYAPKSDKFPVNKAKDRIQRLYRFTNVFGDLLAREDCQARDEVEERFSVYEHFMWALLGEISALKELFSQNRDGLTFSWYPYALLLRDWFRNCVRYARYNKEITLYNSHGRTLGETSDRWSPAVLALFYGSFFNALSPEEVAQYTAMDRAAFEERFFASPESTFRELLSVWLHSDGRYDLSQLMDNPESAQRSFIRVFITVLEWMYPWVHGVDGFAAYWKERYQVVYACAKEIHYPIKPWDEFVRRAQSQGGRVALAPTTDVYKAFLQMYRDLEYRESTTKYTAFFAYARSAIERLSVKQREQAVACCRYAIEAAERALHFTDGRLTYFDDFSFFCASLCNLFTEYGASVSPREWQEVYERQFAIVLDSGITVMTKAYKDLLLLEYPQRMMARYEAVGSEPAVSDRMSWSLRVYATVIRLLQEARYDPDFKDVRYMKGDGVGPEPTSWDDEEYDWDAPLVINDAHSRLLAVVLRAVEALYAINKAAPTDFEKRPYTADMYDDLEEGVLINFEEGSLSYPNSLLKQRIDAVCAENAYPLLTELLVRINNELMPLSSSDDGVSMETLRQEMLTNEDDE